MCTSEFFDLAIISYFTKEYTKQINVPLYDDVDPVVVENVGAIVVETV